MKNGTLLQICLINEMLHIKLFLTFLFVKDFASCEQNKDSDLYYFLKDLPTSASSIKAFCESKTKADLDYFNDVDYCFASMDAKSCCYCPTYFKKYVTEINFQQNLETFYLARTQYPLVYPVRRNLDYYKLKKNLLMNLSSLYLEDNHITEMCIQSKNIKNSTNKNSSEVLMFCELYKFYEYKTKHIYHVKNTQLLFLSLSDVTLEAKNLFEQNPWTAFLNKK